MRRMTEPLKKPASSGVVRLSEAASANIQAARDARSAADAETDARSAAGRRGEADTDATATVAPQRTRDSARPFSQAAGAVLLLHALLVVLFTMLLSASPALRLAFDSTTLRGAALGALLMQGGFILLPTLLIMLLLHVQPQQIAGEPARPGSLALALLVGIPAAVVLSGFNNLLLFILSRYGIEMPAGPQSSLTFDFATHSAAELVLIAIISILLPAIGEELMFRGLVLGSLRERTSESTAIFLQAIVFMAFHTNPAFILPPFLAGLLLGLIRSRSGSLLAAIMAHLSLNASLAMLTAFLPRFTQRLLEITTQSSRSLLYASLMASCLAAVALVPLIILIAGSPAPEYRPRRRRQRQLAVDAPFVLATILLLATIVFRYFNP